MSLYFGIPFFGAVKQRSEVVPVSGDNKNRSEVVSNSDVDGLRRVINRRRNALELSAEHGVVGVKRWPKGLS